MADPSGTDYAALLNPPTNKLLRPYFDRGKMLGCTNVPWERIDLNREIFRTAAATCGIAFPEPDEVYYYVLEHFEVAVVDPDEPEHACDCGFCGYEEQRQQASARDVLERQEPGRAIKAGFEYARREIERRRGLVATAGGGDAGGD